MIFGLLFNLATFAQTYCAPRVLKTKNPDITISKIEVLNGKTSVHLVYEKTNSNFSRDWVLFAHSTYVSS